MTEQQLLRLLLITLNGAKDQLTEVKKKKYALHYVEAGTLLDRTIGWVEARQKDLELLTNAKENKKCQTLN